jgi:flagellar hook protein FlgE
MNGSNIVSVNLNVGTPGSFTGVTQFRSETTTVAREQNGYPMGKLQEVSIDERGEIFGVYTNGISKSLARIYLAEFNNPAGLLKLGDSMYAKSNNSGEAVLQQPGIGTASTIKPGALEMSNVELATEFTSMITTQRGYQANARVITTSDQLLQELVQLVR